MESKEIVDEVARKKLKLLQERFEGGHLTPRLSIIFKQSLHSITSWPGWEMFGIIFASLFSIFILVNIIFFTSNTCAANQERVRTTAEQRITEKYSIACQGANLDFVSYNEEEDILYCSTENKILKITLNNLDHSEVLDMADLLNKTNNNVSAETIRAVAAAVNSTNTESEQN